MIPQFAFEKETAVEAVLYICTHINKPDYHSIAKLLYFADCLHLERYGRFIFGDRYVAMRYGPVPSAVLDMLRGSHVKYQGLIDYPEAIGAFESFNKYDVRPLRQPNMDWLSASDVECLDEAILKYGHYNFRQRTLASHASAWEKTWNTNPNSFIEIELIIEAVGEPEGLREYLQDPYP